MNKLKLFFVLLIFFYSSGLSSDEYCRPKFEIISDLKEIKKKEDKKNPVFVYFDGSLSMQGFVKDQPGQKNLYRDVIYDLQQISENVGSKTYYHKFGSTIEPIKENEIARVTKPLFYDCAGSVESCNNQETRLELAFKAANANKDATYIIVTDLFLSSKQLVGSTLSSLTSPLKSVLKNGNSIGIVGVMSSFNGTIYDIPSKAGGTLKYSEAKKRPFYIIIVGNEKNINLVKKNLKEQHFIDQEDQYKFSLITSSPILKNLNQDKSIKENYVTGISNRDSVKLDYIENNFPIFNFNAVQSDKIKFKIQNNEIIVDGSNGISNYQIDEHLWTSKEQACKKISEDSWKKTKFEKISKWTSSEDQFELNTFEQVALKKLFRGMRYFYLANIYAEKPGNSSEEIFKDWSIRDSEAEDFKDQNPVEFKTLNLSKIIGILNSVADDAFEKTLVASIAMNFDLE